MHPLDAEIPSRNIRYDEMVALVSRQNEMQKALKLSYIVFLPSFDPSLTQTKPMRPNPRPL